MTKGKLRLMQLIVAFLIACMLSGCSEAKTGVISSSQTPASYSKLQGTVAARCTEISKDSISAEIMDEMNAYSSEKFQNLKMAYPYPYDFYYSSLKNDLEKQDAFMQLSLQVKNDHPYAIIETKMDFDSVLEVAYRWPWSQIAMDQYRISQNFGIYYNGDGTYYLEYESYPCDDAKFNSMLSQCVSAAEKQQSFYDKEMAIYGWITSHLEYDYDFTYEVLLENQTAGSVTDGKSVCAGISRFLSLANKKCGIPSNVVVTKNHAFNYAYFQSASYLEDATWDLGKDKNTYGWFLIGKNTRDRNDIDCIHTSYDFFVNCPDLSAYDFLEVDANANDSNENSGLDPSEEAGQNSLEWDQDGSNESEASNAGLDANGDSSEASSEGNGGQDLQGDQSGSETQESLGDHPETAETSGAEEGSGNQSPDDWSESSSDQGFEGVADLLGDQESDEVPDATGDLGAESQSDKQIRSMSVCTTCGDCLVGGSPKDALSVSVTFNDGTERILSRDEYEVVGSTEQIGEQPFTVCYMDWFVDIMLDVKESLSVNGVGVTHCPSYYQGDSIFDSTFAVYVLYTDGSKRYLGRDEYSVSGSTDTLGETSFFVYYKTWVVEVNVTVVARP